VIEGIAFTVAEMRKQRIHRITLRLPKAASRRG
jgi:hypothetical protein